jgi:DNA-binding beta-propeller fold protein YncE
VVPRWVLGVVAAAVAVAAADVTVLVVTRDGTPAAEAQSGGANRVAVIDPTTSRVVDRVRVGRTPTIVVAGYGGAWVLNKDDGTLTQLDARSHHVVDTLRLDVTATDLAVGAGGVWFAGRPKGDVHDPLEFTKLERIDPATGRIDREFNSRTGAYAFAAGGNALWSTGIMAGHVRGTARSDARTGAMRRLDIQMYGDMIAADENAVYWVSSGSHVARVSTRTGLLTKVLPLVSDASLAAGHVPPHPTAVAVGGGAVWISAIDGSLIRVDPNLRRVVTRIPVCRYALAVAYGGGAVWVACGDATVVRVDPKTDRPGAPIHVGALPRGIAAAGGMVRVTLN